MALLTVEDEHLLMYAVVSPNGQGMCSKTPSECQKPLIVSDPMLFPIHTHLE